MTTELEHTPNSQPSADEKLKTIQISDVAWKEAKIFAVRNDSTIKAVVEDAILKHVGATNAA